MATRMDPQLYRILMTAQRDELTGYRVYSRLARRARTEENRRILGRIAATELEHYRTWEGVTGRKLRVSHWKVVLFTALARVFGLTFGLRLMEKAEREVQDIYRGLAPTHPEAEKMLRDEEEHEHELLGMLQDPLLDNIGSVVLGLNDALVELTGVLAGLSFAFQDTRLIGVTGLITGVAASLSMAASEYLSTRAEGSESAGRAALFTGIAYIVTVALLVMPYFIFDHYLVCLAVTLCIAMLIIVVYNFYLSVAKDYSFRKRFLEMAGISLGVATLSFGIGVLVRQVFGVDV
ncbi:MAG: VIT1/CCC1 transporter family protein [Candidatus Krumholzibacteriia bacterium]